MKTVLLVADRQGWAWWWMFQGIAKYAPPEYDVHVLTPEEFHPLTKGLSFLFKHVDAVLQGSWTEGTLGLQVAGVRNCTLLASHGAEFDPRFVVDGIIPHRITTSLRNRLTAKQRLPQFDKVLCVSPRLYGVGKDLVGKKAALTVPGVDTEVFVPIDRRASKKLRLGWCGQRGATKGYDEVLKPLMDAVGDRYEWLVNDRSPDEAMSQSKMRDFYQFIDVFVSTSCSEGFQMPPLEALACGVPTVATACGAVNEVVGFNEAGILLNGWEDIEEAKTRIPELIEALDRLDRDRNLLNAMRGNARDRAVSMFSWKERSEVWLREIAP